MKITIIVPLFPAISETFIINHITGLIDEGHNVNIISLAKPDSTPIHRIVEQYELLDMTTYIKKPPKNKLFRRIYSAFWMLVTMLKHPYRSIKGLKTLLFVDRKEFYRKLFFWVATLPLKSDIYHFHFAQTGRLGAFLKLSGYKIKMYTSFHGYDVNMLPRQKNSDFYRDLFSCNSRFIANTNYTKNQAIKLGCNKSEITVIPVGLHMRDFPYKTKNIPKDDRTIQILTVGRLVEKKGYQYSISAIARLIDEGYNIHYTIVGDGTLRSQLEDLVQNLGVSENIAFMGEKPQQDIIELYKRSDIFVLSSVTAINGDKEGQGLVLQEAQACGLPVVSTLHNGIPDGVLNNQSGLLVPEKDIKSLSEAIKKLINNPSIRQEMGKRGRNFVTHNYDMKIITEKLIKLYNS